MVIVDTSVENYQQLVDDLLNNNQENREIEVVLLDADSDGVEQVSQILAKYNELDAVHLVSHGDTRHSGWAMPGFRPRTLKPTPAKLPVGAGPQR